MAKADHKFEGEVYLKTKSGNFRAYFTKIIGSEIYFYKKEGVDEHEFMHSLTGVFIEEKGLKNVKKDNTGDNLYTIKIRVSAHKARVLYFREEKDYKDWALNLKIASGYSDLFDFYDFVKDLGHG